MNAILVHHGFSPYFQRIYYLLLNYDFVLHSVDWT